MIILIGLLLGILRDNSLSNFRRSFGFNSIMITGFIGVPIHECSHAIFALLFRHSINDIKLLQMPDENGTLGYVRHSFDPNSIYQQIGNFFIGIGPIIGGVISLLLLMKIFLPYSYAEFVKISMTNRNITNLNIDIIKEILNSYYELIKTIFTSSNFKNPSFFLFLFLSICISSHISLSKADIDGASKGLGVIFIIIILLNMFGLTNYISISAIIKYNVVLTGFLLVALIFSLITYIISEILASIIK
ncbi:hypothetical protein CLOSAC_13220 [Clostridium saccharobutylicum]|uniref:Uncharacterized protein n=2 Tax=Clostridium saccharobutylicum TaxID=169679 RepID=A0A1S8NDI9_CLOSA|nr:hypothetical protein [Clostridium saccharobutylicum]OOM14442.1 hypothetical protein CLOSAC_13220 [Clostridium saccharobutylicum]